MLRADKPTQRNENKDSRTTPAGDETVERATDESSSRTVSRGSTAVLPRTPKKVSTRRLKEFSDLKKAYDALESDNTRLEATLSSVKLANHNFFDRAKQTWGERKALMEKLDRAEEAIRQLEGRAKDDQERLAKLTGACEKVTQLTQELNACRRQQKEVQALLEVRTSELRQAQACFGMPDSVADSEVQRIVEKLNSEIFQMAAQITDAFPFEEYRVPRDYAAWHAEYVRLTQSVGNTLVDAILHYSHSGDPILVQLSLQAYLAERVFWTVKAWDVRLSGERNGMLDRVYQRILNIEPQSLTTRWRVVTRRHLSEALGEWPGGLLPALKEHLQRDLVCLLIFSGVPISTADIEQKMATMFAGKILNIAQQTIDLRKLLGEDVTSSEFQLICPWSDVPFSGTTMENIDERKGQDQVSHETLPILSTADLGLSRCAKRQMMRDGKETHELEESVLIKAKVVLPSMLHDWLQQEEASKQPQKVV